MGTNAHTQATSDWYESPALIKKHTNDKYKRFMPMCEAAAQMSNYSGTKVGCLILSDRHSIRATGWNGSPRGCAADRDGRSSRTREERLMWATHAEQNAIANAAADGASLLGCTLLVTLMPCMTCAKSIVQAGITRVICPPPNDERWGEEFALAIRLFEECGVSLVYT